MSNHWMKDKWFFQYSDHKVCLINLKHTANFKKTHTASSKERDRAREARGSHCQSQGDFGTKAHAIFMCSASICHIYLVDQSWGSSKGTHRQKLPWANDSHIFSLLGGLRTSKCIEPIVAICLLVCGLYQALGMFQVEGYMCQNGNHQWVTKLKPLTY